MSVTIRSRIVWLPLKNIQFDTHRTVVSSAFGYKISSLTLREKRSLKMLKNWVLRKKYGLKSEGVTESWRTLHNRSCSFRTPHQIVAPSNQGG
jgi:hypothetical protein